MGELELGGWWWRGGGELRGWGDRKSSGGGGGGLWDVGGGDWVGMWSGGVGIGGGRWCVVFLRGGGVAGGGLRGKWVVMRFLLALGGGEEAWLLLLSFVIYM